MIAADGDEHLVAAAQSQLANELRRDERITGLGQVAVFRAAYESGVALRVEPAGHLSFGHDRCGRFLLALLAARAATATLVPRVPAATLSPATTAPVLPVTALTVPRRGRGSATARVHATATATAPAAGTIVRCTCLCFACAIVLRVGGRVVRCRHVVQLSRLW